MLRTKIIWTTVGSEEGCAYLDISNTSIRRISDYRYTLYNPDRTWTDRGLFEGYPRWSEPVGALVARILCQARSCASGPSGLRAATNLARIGIFVEIIPGGLGHSRSLEEITLDLIGRKGKLCHTGERLPYTNRTYELREDWNDPLRTAERLLCQVAFRADTVPPVPEPLNPPIHDCEGRKFVRLSEIREPARSAFALRLMIQRLMPTFPGEREGNVADLAAWRAFVGE